MSDSQGYEEVTVSDDGITVTKRFEEDEFPVPAIAFEFSSEREEGVLVRIRDSVPESVSVEDLGFHPEYGSEHWSVEGDTISFQRELEPEADYTTVYGIRATGTDDVEQFLTEPTIERVDPSPSAGEESDASEDVPSVDDDIIPEIVSDEPAASSGGDDALDSDAEDDEDVETLELRDPNEEAGAGEATSRNDAASIEEAVPDDAGSPIPDEPESLVSALAAEIRDEGVDSEDLDVLREALDVADRERGSIQARVERVQSDVADLRAYSDALEEFLDENGTAEQLIEDFRSDVSTLESTVENMESIVEENDDELAAVSEDVDSLGEEVSDLSQEVSSVGDDVERVETNLSEFEAAVDDIQSSIESLEDQVTEGDVADRLEDLEAELEDMREWQKRIQDTFAG